VHSCVVGLPSTSTPRRPLLAHAVFITFLYGLCRVQNVLQMKFISTATLMFFFLYGFPQYDLGKTKSFILQEYNSWSVLVNTNQVLIIKKYERCQFFSFNPADNYVCDVWATELPVGAVDMKQAMLQDAFFVNHYDHYKTPYPPCIESTPFPACSLWKKGEHLFVELLEANMCNEVDNISWTVIFETWPHKN